ncbi:hypothetical protein [Agromyces sp. S2-1-8]|uniref:glycosyltransferase family protein n=1 Tax=Agromyces sp. S2-1-8 TaxID=2897180 RepID=UPI001E2AA215|nr:hypothetical protein [Agromyces sp. S2-1-8]MCD5347776.1 hypothetical protein [Agromyces sp. S2-1-8]
MSGLGSVLAPLAPMLARLVPEPLLLRVLPSGLRWDPTGLAVAVAPSSRVAVFIGPANSAGQGFRWANAIRNDLDGAAAVSLATIPRGARNPAFPVDVAVPLAATVFSRRWQRAQRRELVEGFSHALIESGRHPFRGALGGSAADPLRELSRSGLSVAFLWHGSDIRLPSAHARSEPDSPFGRSGSYPDDQTARLERNAAANLEAVAESDFPVFVSTPGLLDVPRAVWLPVVVDIDSWTAPDAPLTSDRPVVAYAPSNPAMKGDPSIDARLQRLDARGVIRYRRLEGVPATEMPGVYRAADIVLDQFRLGDYGVAACEAMAAGRVVVGHVSDRVRTEVQRATGRELPIVESRIDAVEETVLALLDDRAGARAMAASGRAFVEAVHDGRASARTLSEFLGTSAASEASDQERP